MENLPSNFSDSLERQTNPTGPTGRNFTQSLIAVIVVASLLSGLMGGFVVWFYLRSCAPPDQGAAPAANLARAQAAAHGENVRQLDEQNTIQVVEIASRGVVQVKVTLASAAPRPREVPDFFGIPSPMPRTMGNGSGFMYDNEGHIITSNHVVQGAQKIDVILASGKTYEAKVVGSDPLTDIAVIRIDADQADIHPLRLGDSDAVKVGQKAIVVGSPLATGSNLGLDRSSSVTQGIISAKDRSLPIQSETDPSVREFSVENLLQTDAAVNPGNSGGPLLDSSGAVIGVVTALVTDANNIGLAVPINVVKQVIPQLSQGKQVRRAYLGITYVGLDELKDTLGDSFPLLDLPVGSGALVIKVTAGSAADVAGLQGGSREMVIDGRPITLGGDIITEVNGRPIKGSNLSGQVLEFNPGDVVVFTYVRDGKTHTTQVKLGER